MKTIEQDMLEEIYIKADKIAKENKQTTGGGINVSSYYFITLEQLENIIKSFEE